MTESSGDDKTMAVLCHALAFIGVAVPLGNVLGPLIIWLIQKDKSPMVDEHGKESLNFQISMTIWMLIAGALVLVVIGIFLLPILGIAWLVLTIIGTIKASSGELFRYPLTIRMIN